MFKTNHRQAGAFWLLADVLGVGVLYLGKVAHVPAALVMMAAYFTQAVYSLGRGRYINGSFDFLKSKLPAWVHLGRGVCWAGSGWCGVQARQMDMPATHVAALMFLWPLLNVFANRLTPGHMIRLLLCCLGAILVGEMVTADPYWHPGFVTALGVPAFLGLGITLRDYSVVLNARKTGPDEKPECQYCGLFRGGMIASILGAILYVTDPEHWVVPGFWDYVLFVAIGMIYCNRQLLYVMARRRASSMEFLGTISFLALFVSVAVDQRLDRPLVQAGLFLIAVANIWSFIKVSSVKRA